MNKYLPFVFPLAALLIVLFLAFRWFSMQTNRSADIGEGVEIEDLTLEQESMLRGTDDLQQVELQTPDTETEGQGDIRYKISDERVRFSVNANLPQPEGFYQVWVRSGETQQKAFRLLPDKGGFMGSAALNQSALPFEVIVSQETEDDDQLEQVILRGRIEE